MYIEGVEIKISPEVIIEAVINGKTCYGGLKIHVCKGKPFDQTQSSYVAILLQKFIEKHVSKESGIVIPELCFCLDVFGDRLLPCPPENTVYIGEIKSFCKELKQMWDN